ncbi:hypothetical protein F5884DRAFT_788366, partial [Xylogone sp. PMI_703]
MLFTVLIVALPTRTCYTTPRAQIAASKRCRLVSGRNRESIATNRAAGHRCLVGNQTQQNRISTRISDAAKLENYIRFYLLTPNLSLYLY